ncbi:glycine zipper 2TM domain-containing protein [Polaromonas sp.]|uniref:glycine zipper 2TM domain-containing protein n=1 Tax=Polaromonas sp. TaxID=1869339 RepID=UPI003CB7D1A2
MKKAIVLSTVAAASGLFAASASAMDILARVISSTPVVQQVSVPQQVCTTQPMITQAPPSGAGAVMGALAGGAMGNAVGDGGGRALATVIGLVGGAMVGNNIEGNRNQVQNVQQCGTQTSYENRTTHYNVVYEYADKQYTIQMPNDPGLYVRLQVTPVGAMPAQPAPQANVQQGYVQPPQPVYSQQPVYAQPVYAQPVYVQPAVVAYPGYYPRPYYPPVGVSLNFGYSRGYGHHHWR